VATGQVFWMPRAGNIVMWEGESTLPPGDMVGDSYGKKTERRYSFGSWHPDQREKAGTNQGEGGAFFRGCERSVSCQERLGEFRRARSNRKAFRGSRMEGNWGGGGGGSSGPATVKRKRGQ